MSTGKDSAHERSYWDARGPSRKKPDSALQPGHSELQKVYPELQHAIPRLQKQKAGLTVESGLNRMTVDRQECLSCVLETRLIFR